MILRVTGASFRYPDATADALRDVSLTVDEGELVAVLGPNGSGKTTLVRLILGTLTAREGTVDVLGRSAGDWPRRDLARQVAVVAQREDNPFPQRVRDAVMLGRYPHLSPWGAERGEDRAAVRQALERCDVAYLSERWMATLSGGEYQRVRVARALAQQPRLLVLDEPSTSLDIRHEMELFELMRALATDRRFGVLLITHHLNLAARFADRLVLLSEGRPAAQGTPDQVLTAASIRSVFGWPVAVQPFDGRPQVIPLRKRDTDT